MEYTAVETLFTEEEIPSRVKEVKESLSKTHPEKEVSFRWCKEYGGLWSLYYTIQ